MNRFLTKFCKCGLQVPTKDYEIGKCERCLTKEAHEKDTLNGNVPIDDEQPSRANRAVEDNSIL